MTIGEALAAGTPAVVHSAGALGDWTAEKGCVCVDDRSPDRVAAAVQSTQKRSPASTPLPTWDEVTEELIDIYSP